MASLARRAAVLGFAWVASTALAQGEVNIVCGVPITWCEAMTAAFTRATGITVNLTLKGAGEALAQIAFERPNPRYDVWYAGAAELHLQAAAAGLTEEYRSPMLPELYDWAVRQAEQSRWHSVAVHASILGIGYNRDLLARKKLPPPSCWADLARPEYHDEVLVSNPSASSTGYSMLASWVQIFGEEKAFELLRGIHRNASQYPRTDTGAIRAAARGETSIAVTFLRDGVAEIINGFPITLTVPCEGAGYEVGAMSIIKGGPNPEPARKFYDWALTPAAQKIAGETKNFRMPSNRSTPIPPEALPMSGIRLIQFDFAKYGSATERRRLLERWDREVNALPR